MSSQNAPNTLPKRTPPRPPRIASIAVQHKTRQPVRLMRRNIEFWTLVFIVLLLDGDCDRSQRACLNPSSPSVRKARAMPISESQLIAGHGLGETGPQDNDSPKNANCPTEGALCTT